MFASFCSYMGTLLRQAYIASLLYAISFTSAALLITCMAFRGCLQDLPRPWSQQKRGARR